MLKCCRPSTLNQQLALGAIELTIGSRTVFRDQREGMGRGRGSGAKAISSDPGSRRLIPKNGGSLRMTLDELRYQVAMGSRILSMTGVAAGVRASMGHVSLRDPNDANRFVVKGRGYEIDVLSRMRPENMVVCDLRGYLLDGPPGVLQCNEVMIHACVLS